MNLYKEIIQHEVFPALGCTEPIAAAYTASIAAAELGERPESIQVTVDAGVFKNGFAVTVPNSNGEKGNMIATALGALIANPKLKMEILQGVNEGILSRAKQMLADNKVTIFCDREQATLFIDVTVTSASGSARAVVQGGHTNLVILEKNGESLININNHAEQNNKQSYREILGKLTVAEMIDLLDKLDEDDFSYLRKGISMNLAIAEKGKGLKKVGYYVADLVSKGLLVDDAVSNSKVLAAAASDARMSGLAMPVMSSGGSGNQGIVSSLVPYCIGLSEGIPERTIFKSIALSHVINAFIKCYTGDLAPICGCAIAAGVGAAAAIVYQQAGKDIKKIDLAVNTLISDLGGMLCDGAKGGCALKVVSSADSAIRAAYMALNGHGITDAEGFIGKSAEETIKNMSRISEIGMSQVDATMLDIMLEKSSRQ